MRLLPKRLVILSAKAFLDKNPKATEPEIQQALSGVLCRCFTHVAHATQPSSDTRKRWRDESA